MDEIRFEDGEMFGLRKCLGRSWAESGCCGKGESRSACRVLMAQASGQESKQPQFRASASFTSSKICTVH
jgi:hypothetical protein